MAYTKYSLTPANNNAAPPDGAPEGMLPSAVNDTMRDMMAQIRDCGDGIRGGTYTMTAPVITGGSISGATGSFTTLAYSSTLTGGTGVVNIGSGQFYKDSSGNVGIGTSSPTTKLDIRVTTNPATDNGVGVNTLKVFTNVAQAAGVGGAIALGGYYNATPESASFGQIAGRKENSTADNLSGYLQFSTLGSAGTMTERMRIASTGYVGIGTASPNYALEVNVSAGSSISATSGNAEASVHIKNSLSDVYLFNSYSSNTVGLYDSSLAALMTYARASNQWDFYTSSVSRMTINNVGQVGIGTASPSYKLHIVDAQNSGILCSSSNAGGYSYLQLLNTTSGNWQIVTGGTSSAYNGSLAIYDATASAARLSIDTSGNLLLSNSAQYYGMNQYAYKKQMVFNYPVTGFGAFIDATDFYTAGTYSNTVKMRISGNGSVGCAGSFLGGQTLDYAEYFEWADGNTVNEDRIGSSVVLENGFIRLATLSDSKESIIGAVSATAGVILGSSPFEWAGKFLKDDFGRDITEDVTWLNWTDEEDRIHNYKINEVPSDLVVPENAETRTYKQPILNPAYKENAEYQDRGSRKEWACIGLMGQIRIKKGQPTGLNWIKMKDISPSVELWFVK